MQLRLHNRKLQWLKNNLRCRYVEQRLNYLIHAYGTISERDPCRITPQLNSLKTRTTPKLATAFRYLIYKHILTSHVPCQTPTQQYCNGCNDTQFCSGHNEQVWMKKKAIKFARWSHYFGYDKKWFHTRNIKSRSIYEYFYQKLSRSPDNKANDPHGVAIPRLKTPVLNEWPLHKKHRDCGHKT